MSARKHIVPGTGSQPPGSPRTSLRRMGWLLLGSLGVAVTIVLVIAWLTPPADKAPEILPAGEPVAETVALPSKAVVASVEQLRKEGEEVAEDLLARFPGMPEAMHAAAVLYADLQQTQKAEEIWLECVKTAPRHAGPHVGLATVAMERGDDERAVCQLRKALSEGCSTPELYRTLASALKKLGRLTESAEALEAGLARFPDAREGWIVLGQTQLQLQRFADAEKSLRRALDLDPQSAEACFGLATACLRQGKDDEAAACRKRFAELRARFPMGAGRRFQEVYEVILRRVVADALSRAAVVFRQQDDQAQAERLLRRALAIQPASAESCRALAALYRDQGRIADNRAVQQRLVEIEPENLANHLNLASLYAQLGDRESAEGALRRAIQVRPDATIAYVTLAAICLQTGRAEQARSLAEQSLQRQPTAQGYAVLAAACRQLGDHAGAETALAHAKKLAPADPGLPSSTP